jgi:hypothetical protein
MLIKEICFHKIHIKVRTIRRLSIGPSVQSSLKRDNTLTIFGFIFTLDKKYEKITINFIE